MKWTSSSAYPLGWARVETIAEGLVHGGARFLRRCYRHSRWTASSSQGSPNMPGLRTKGAEICFRMLDQRDAVRATPGSFAKVYRHRGGQSAHIPFDRCKRTACRSIWGQSICRFSRFPGGLAPSCANQEQLSKARGIAQRKNFDFTALFKISRVEKTLSESRDTRIAQTITQTKAIQRF